MKILIQPLTLYDTSVISDVTTIMKEKINAEFYVSSTQLQPPLRFFNFNRKQYDASKLLLWLREETKGYGLDRVIGLAEIDAYVESLNFVFGIASESLRTALVFTLRLRPDFYGINFDYKVYITRIVKEILHELGHTLHLNHCNNKRCVMSFSNSIIEVDYKEAAFCEKCTETLKSLGIKVLKAGKLST